MTADDIIALLDLAPHPEGGHFRQTWIGGGDADRAAGTCIYFLLKETEVSHWHRVDAAEIWHHYSGAPLELRIAETEAGPAQALTLGPDLAVGQRPQGIVPAGHWQAARPLGGWTLVGCTVSPAFDFAGFELAAPGFDIP
ncbi:cupin domain-containing protein [Pseudooceanicola sp. CBS1P-1]|uniref:Cupin n=1 Tax=Pseudooceanicola albus TaxID=2692189 RepID=A0A6L7G1G7_9RHOB|nr:MULTISPECIES: cupin domain-containing protein [Pseudooceanicola]MBT9383698.1 cupin domain-containing protein [Pseudooceanicola endophyticus]MXN17552.1 cupin [Pseudooceanicola albus]